MSLPHRKFTAKLLVAYSVSDIIRSFKISFRNLTATGPIEYTPPRDHMAVYCQKVNFGFYKGNGVNFNWHKEWIPGALNTSSVVLKCQFRLTSGKNFIEIFFSENFYCTKSSALEFKGESLELFFSDRVHFRRYRHFRVFWQSTAWWTRRC